MDRDLSAAECGFRVIRGGEGGLGRVLAENIDRERPPAEAERYLGAMVRWVRRNIEKAAYQPVIDIIQDVLHRNMPFGVGDVILRPVDFRYVHCVNSAHIEFGLPKDRVRALMKSNDPDFRDELSDARTYFNAEKLRPIMELAHQTITSQEAAKELGLSYQGVHDLLKAGLLDRAERKEDELRPYTRIRRQDLYTFAQAVIDKASAPTEVGSLLTLRQASASCGRKFPVLVRLIIDGTLEAAVVPGPEPVFKRLRVTSNGLAVVNSLKSADEEYGVRLREVEAILKTSWYTVNCLVRHGILKQRMMRRENGRNVGFVEQQSLSDFMSSFVSLSELATHRKVFRAKIKAELEQLGVKPLFENEPDMASFYRRLDLEKVGF